MKKILLIPLFLIWGAFFLSFTCPTAMAVEPVMSTYSAYPPFLSQSVKPNVLVLLDTSTSMMLYAYTGSYNPSTTYDGLFGVDNDPNYIYKYNSTYEYFYVHSKWSSGDPEYDSGAGEWRGNLLNWISMRRMDIAKKVLTGGRTRTAGDGSLLLLGQPYPSGSGWPAGFEVGTKSYGVNSFYNKRVVDAIGPYFRINNSTTGTKRYIRAKVTSASGIIQDMGAGVRFGLEIYSPTYLSWAHDADQGGKVLVPCADGTSTHLGTIVTQINNQDMLSSPLGVDTWTPMAESLYSAAGYFRQHGAVHATEGPLYATGDYFVSALWDPLYFDASTGYVRCAKNFVILISDGESNHDSQLPASLRTSIGRTGTDMYLDDVALYAHTTDLRGAANMGGSQTITLYCVSTFGGGAAILRSAAIYGGFEDINGDNLPGPSTDEYDEDGDGVPDNYYEGSNVAELRAGISSALLDIMKRIAAASAVSVLATTGEGEGNVVQASFKPSIITTDGERRWIGYIQSLWLDSHGNIREDTDDDLSLNVEVDKVISFFLDTATGEAKVKRYDVSGTTPYPDLQTDIYTTIGLTDVDPLWEAGSVLAARAASDRDIFTYVDMDKDQVVDSSGALFPFDSDGELVKFHTDSAASIKPYLGVQDNAAWSYLSNVDHDTRVNNVINYIRGSDIAGLRPRTISGNVWKLADVIHSTPSSIARAPDNFHIIYSDESYQAYYDATKDRETMVYVGANDGMLHAFTSWQYVDSGTSRYYSKPAAAPGGESIGQELWAYIPQSLLPHLKWLPSVDYSHVYYVDMRPKIFDAKIIDDDTYYTDADNDDDWGTILLVGLRMGGKQISVTDDFDDGSGVTVSETRVFNPSYSCLDVTDPRSPRLLWERTYTDLELATSVPAVVKVKDNWFAVFGSGPSEFDGTTTKTGHVFVVDLKTGAPYKNLTNDWLFNSGVTNSFINSPVSVDKDLNYSVDAIYMGETTYDSGSSSWKGKLYKIAVPWVDAGAYDGVNRANYVDDPKDGANPWVFSSIFDAERPITSPIALSIDFFDNVWLYVGSGRYLSQGDKSNTDTQYLFGIKDPFFNEDHTPAGLYGDDYYHNYTTSLEITQGDLFDADPYYIIEGGQVFLDDGTPFGDFDDVLDEARIHDGWIKTLTLSGERVITKFAVLGGIVFTPSFVPNSDVCGFEGDSYLYGQYFETGTAYYNAVFTGGTETVTISGVDYTRVLSKVGLGTGKASAVGLHIGSEEGAKGLIQQSTGTIVSESLNPAFNVKSGLRSWRER